MNFYRLLTTDYSLFVMKKFQRRIEDFACENCGTNVFGDGYTNHCPKCLWSKHVDINPGDRAEKCGGLLEPVAVEGASPNYDIVHRCLACGKTVRNKISSGDDNEVIIAIVKMNALETQ